MPTTTTPGDDFDALWAKVEDTLAAAGEVLSPAEKAERQRITREALDKYTGKPWISAAIDDDIEDQSPRPVELRIPPQSKVEPYWYDDPEFARTLDHYILARRKLGGAMHGALLITGMAGLGKTMSVGQAVQRINTAHPLNLRLFKMDCSTVTDPAKWFGRREADETGTHFIRSDFVEAVERGDVVLLDEIKRVHPHIHNPVMALLDGSEEVNVSDLNLTIRRHPQTVFIATANEGAQYGGNHRMDWSMRERFSTTLERTPPPADEEVRILTTATACDPDAAETLVAIARKTRDMHDAGDLRAAISTRTLVAAAMWVGFGLDEWGALAITAVPEFDGDASGMMGSESDRGKVLGIMEGRLGRARR